LPITVSSIEYRLTYTRAYYKGELLPKCVDQTIK